MKKTCICNLHIKYFTRNKEKCRAVTKDLPVNVTAIGKDRTQGIALPRPVSDLYASNPALILTRAIMITISVLSSTWRPCANAPGTKSPGVN
jgi:hypothetical protein